MNRIAALFEEKKYNVLSVYFTAGYPALASTVEIAKHLEQAGADMIEIGIPFSDPVADGPIIQNSSKTAIANGMTVQTLLEQVRIIRSEVSIPIVLMSYLNPIVQYGFEGFCMVAADIGVDGLIIPDMPLDTYERDYRQAVEDAGLCISFLIAPSTSYDKIKKIDRLSSGFVYAVSSATTTGTRSDFASGHEMYFERLQAMKLTKPLLIGFGVSSYRNFYVACKFAAGAIVGSTFIDMLSQSKELEKDIKGFIARMRMSSKI